MPIRVISEQEAQEKKSERETKVTKLEDWRELAAALTTLQAGKAVSLTLRTESIKIFGTTEKALAAFRQRLYLRFGELFKTRVVGEEIVITRKTAGTSKSKH